VALAVAFSFSMPAMAAPLNGLSVDLGFAYNTNGADMGATILKDGEEGAGNGLFGDVILSENTMLAASDSGFLAVAAGNPALVAPISSVSDDGAMSGINIALRLRYDFLNMFFARLGFTYDVQTGGGDDSFRITNDTATLQTLLVSKGVAPGALGAWVPSIAGKTVTQEWTYGSWSIPITIGINIPLSQKFNLYAGLGLTYWSGWWQLEASAPAGYIVDDRDNSGVIDAVDLNAIGAVKEEVKFSGSGIGINWVVGVTAEVYENVSLYVEIDTTTAAAMSDNENLSTTGGRFAFSSTKITYPVNMSSQFVRFGVIYNIGTPWM